MKFLISLGLILAAPFSTAAPKETGGQAVDAGSFGIYVGGKRTATETFSIQQSNSGSVVTADFKTEDGGASAHQTSELELAPNGDLRRYEFKELVPGKAQGIVTPNDAFLIQRSTVNPGDKPEEHPYLMPTSTSVLDDFVFIHREVLAWRYLATGCKQDKGAVQCPLKQKTQMGVVIPHGQTSMLVNVQFQGREKVQVKGQERELNRFDVDSEGASWQLWLDDSFKVVRMTIPDESTEILRD